VQKGKVKIRSLRLLGNKTAKPYTAKKTPYNQGIINQFLTVKRAGQSRDKRLIKISTNFTRRCASIRSNDTLLGSAFADFQGTNFDALALPPAKITTRSVK